MPKLHELLAVEGDLEGIHKKILEENKVTFAKKAGLFFGFLKTLEMFEEGAPKAPEEHQELATTVQGKLDYQTESAIRYFDAVLQKERTNQHAKADIIIDGMTVAKEMPATFLLGLETRLKNLRVVYDVIPTLPPGQNWQKDESMGDHVYVAEHPEETFKTARTTKSKVLVPAQFPKEGEGGTSLPAQVDKWEETENVGRYTKKTWSGMISPAEKSVLMGRIDTLIRAVKKARQRANMTEIVKISIGKEIFTYIHGE